MMMLLMMMRLVLLMRVVAVTVADDVFVLTCDTITYNVF